MSDQSFGFIYLWRDKKNKRYYIGSHWGTEDDGYICSSAWMQKAYRNRPNDFKRRIISKIYTNRNDLLEEEFRWFQFVKPNKIKIRYYNLSLKRFNHWSANEKNNESIKERISKNVKIGMAKPENRQRYLDGLKTRSKFQSEETRRKRSESMKKTLALKFPIKKIRPKKDSEEHKMNLSLRAKKQWSDPEYKKKVSASISAANKGLKNRLGHKNSGEHNRKIGIANATIAKNKKIQLENRV